MKSRSSRPLTDRIVSPGCNWSSAPRLPTDTSVIFTPLVRLPKRTSVGTSRCCMLPRISKESNQSLYCTTKRLPARIRDCLQYVALFCTTCLQDTHYVVVD